MVLVALNGFRGLWYIYVFRFLILFSSIIPIRCVSHLHPMLSVSVFIANVFPKVFALTSIWARQYMHSKLCRTARFQVLSYARVHSQKNSGGSSIYSVTRLERSHKTVRACHLTSGSITDKSCARNGDEEATHGYDIVWV